MIKRNMTLNVAILTSGNGSNFEAIVRNAEKGILDIAIKVVISDKKDAFVLKRAKIHGIKAVFVGPQGKTREEHEREIAAILEKEHVGLVVLAGYMRILTAYFVRKYNDKILNIHPSLLPKYPGIDGYGDAWKNNDKEYGCTVHFVREQVDAGPIILQRKVRRQADDTFERFKARGMEEEYKAYSEAIKLYAEGKLKIDGQNIKILHGKQ